MNRTHAPTLSRKEVLAMNISLAAGVLMLLLKWTAFLLTNSAAIFSDALETIVHIAAVAFASYSLRVAYRPPDSTHHFGHDKITYFSSGLEGLLIVIAAIAIIYEAIEKWIRGLNLEQLGIGIALTGGAAFVNLLLGLYLVRTGTSTSSLILVANGKHVLTDAWTSVGVIIGLALALWTGILWFDPLLAIVFALNILWEGGKLVHTAADGLMDKNNPILEQQARQALEDFCIKESLNFHRLRLRESGARVYVDFHLQFPNGTVIEDAHTLATSAEDAVRAALGQPADVMSHLESRHAAEHD